MGDGFKSKENEDLNNALIKEQKPENQFGGEVRIPKSTSK